MAVSQVFSSTFTVLKFHKLHLLRVVILAGYAH